MQRKTIKKIMAKHLGLWVETIEDEGVRKIAAANAIVTGGSIASLLLGEAIKDFDIYLRTKDAAIAIADYYVKKFVELNPQYASTVVRLHTARNIHGVDEERVGIYVPSKGVAGANPDDEGEAATGLFEEKPDEGKGEFKPVFLSENAITLSDKLQIVIRFYGEPSEIHNNYDFAHAKNWYSLHDNHLHLDPLALECLLSKTLVYAGSLYPICSIFRVRKFITRGWHISAGELLKIMWQISELDLKDIGILREQLTGVDAAYFFQLIEALESVEPEKLSSAYVAEIIDRIFQGE